MEIRVVSGDITAIPGQAAIVNLFEGVEHPAGATGAVDQALDGAISRLIAEGEIKGKLNEVTIIHTLNKIAPARVVVMGLGKQEGFNLDKIRGVAATALKRLRRIGVERVTTITHGAGIAGLEPEKAAQALVEGSILGLYEFRKHMTREPEHGEVEELIIVERDQSKVPALESGCAVGRAMGEATNLARDMINEPGNAMTPSAMADMARKVAADRDLECEVLEREQMQELGMGALLGVAQGSRQPPKLIRLTYRGGGEKNLGILGKGITFDSGGISIKPAQGMSDMKGDMAGGAAVIAAMHAIGELRPPLNVTALVAATENLPGGAALKPGDIVKAMNGKTIEIDSTDAEGRLTLADALGYARQLGLSPLVDVATLTGACRVALGPVCTGAFANNQELVDKVIAAGEEAGEKIWQMPMYDEYKELNKSDCADIKNSGGRDGGAITAAQFLAEFSEDTPWVHLDIASTSFSEKEGAYTPKGGKGVMVRTLVNLALALSKER